MVPLVGLLAAGPDATRWPTSVLIAGAIVGGMMAVLAVSVSFLEDQALRTDTAGRLVIGYYELIDPAPGRPNNRYRLGYVPFVTAMGTPGWSGETPLGQGPDYFPLHLAQARRQLPDGRTIPPSMGGGGPRCGPRSRPAQRHAAQAGSRAFLRVLRVLK